MTKLARVPLAPKKFPQNHQRIYFPTDVHKRELGTAASEAIYRPLPFSFSQEEALPVWEDVFEEIGKETDLY
jgi:hypothetical protein